MKNYVYKYFIVMRSITNIEGIPHVATISECPLIRCAQCEYSYIDKVVDGKPHYRCEWRPELGEVAEDWFCADACDAKERR